MNSLEDAIDVVKDDAQPFIIGGGEIYAQAMSLADKLELTRVHHRFEGADTYFPKVNPDHWEEVSNVLNDKDEEHAYAFSFITYVRR